MADKRTHNATLMSKQLGQFITDSQAAQMASRQGGHSMLIVDARHGQLITNEDGTQVIKLNADAVELVPDEHSEKVREFQRALYFARPDQHGQKAFEGTDDGAPSVDQAAAQLDAVVERDESGAPTGVWSGDPDAPLAEPGAEPGSAQVKVPEPAKGKASAKAKVANPFASVPDAPDECPFKGCTLPAEHDGDHNAEGFAE